jgi:hypothetical protein
MKEWHQLTSLMTDRFEDEHIHRLGMLLVAGQGAVLLAIYFFHWVSSALAINILVVLPSILAFGGNSANLALQRKRIAVDAIAAARAQGAKIGRNDPCPCGSGKKFKFCHGVRDGETENA